MKRDRPYALPRAALACSLVAQLLGGVACELARPDFGGSCATDTACETGYCDLTLQRCVIAPADAAQGQSCDDPRVLELGEGEPFAAAWVGSASMRNTAQLGAGRALFLRVDIPEQIGADGAPRAGSVVRMTVDTADKAALVDVTAACTLAGRAREEALTAAEAEARASELLDIRAPPGPRWFAVMLDGVSDIHAVDLRARVEQVRCPFGFAPTATGCTGFVTAAGPSGRVGHTVTAIDGERVLVVGGERDGGRLTDAYLFEHALGAFVPYGLSGPRAGHTAIVLDDGSVLVVGGGLHEYTDATLYDAARRRFLDPERLSSMYGPTYGQQTGAALSGARTALVASDVAWPALVVRPLSVVGESCDHTFDCGYGLVCVQELADANAEGVCLCASESCSGTNDDLAWSFDISLDDFLIPEIAEYTRGAALNVRGPAGSYAVFTGGLCSPGGGAPRPSHGAVFDPSGAALSRLDALMLVPRLDVRAVDVGGELVIVGGRTLDEAPSALVEVGSPLHTSAAEPFALRAPRTDFALVALPDGNALVIGGRGADGALLHTTEIIDVEARQTHDGPELPVALADAQAAALSDGSVLIVGGVTPDGLLPDPLWLRHIEGALDAPRYGARFDATPGPERCTLAPVLTDAVGTIVATTFGSADDYNGASIGDACTDGYSTRGPDACHAFLLPAGQQVDVRLRPLANADVSIVIVDDPLAGEGSCVGGADVAGFSEGESVRVDAHDDARTLYVVVDSYWPEGFAYELSWEAYTP